MDWMSQLPAHVRGSIVDVIEAPGGGAYAVGRDGGVFALGGAQFHGSIPGLKNDSVKGRHTIGKGGFRLLDGGGYEVTDSEGRKYAFQAPKPAPAPANQLYSDPDFLAFVRGADYTIDSAAADVARKQAAVNRALATDLTLLQSNRDQDIQNTSDSHEARGVYRGGARLKDIAKQEANYATREGQMRDTAASQVSDLGSGLANTVAGLQMQSAEKGYGTGGQQALTGVYQKIQKKYPGQFPTISGSPKAPV